MPSKPFQFGSEAVASAGFTYSGVRYAKGQRFPYKDLGVIEFDLRGLWLADLVEFGARAAEPSDADLERLTAPAAKPAPAKQQAAPARR